VLVPGRFQLVVAVVLLSLWCQRSGFVQTTSASALDSTRSEYGSSEEIAKQCSADTSPKATVDCGKDTSTARELSALGQRGSVIAHVREVTLDILQSDNTCSAWFEEADPNVAEVFRSLHYDLDASGTADIYSSRDKFGELLFMHPWGARSREYAGRNSFIQINGNGPFFVPRSRVTPTDPNDGSGSVVGLIPTLIGPYKGATIEAQVTIMLHELGHITGRLPKDDYSWNGSSSRNTSEVLRHCKKEIRQVARESRDKVTNVDLRSRTSAPLDQRQTGVDN